MTPIRTASGAIDPNNLLADEEQSKKMMQWYDWLIVVVPVLFVLGMGLYSRRASPLKSCRWYHPCNRKF